MQEGQYNINFNGDSFLFTVVDFSTAKELRSRLIMAMVNAISQGGCGVKPTTINKIRKLKNKNRAR